MKTAVSSLPSATIILSRSLSQYISLNFLMGPDISVKYRRNSSPAATPLFAFFYTLILIAFI